MAYINRLEHANAQGTAESDWIMGSDSSESLSGGEGSDTIYGAGGNDDIRGDTLKTAENDDVLLGGSGNDTVVGYAGNDLILGGEGNDYLYGNLGLDYLNGGKGADTIYGGQGNDYLIGGKNNDFLFGDLGSDVMKGRQGSDVFALRVNPEDGDVDFITDFKDGVDKIGLTGGVTFDQIVISQATGNEQFPQAGSLPLLNSVDDRDVLIALNTGAIIAVVSAPGSKELSAGDLAADDFIFSPDFFSFP